MPRTLLDLATLLTQPELESAINEVEVKRLWERLSLVDLLDRHPRRRGTPAIRSILGAGQLEKGVPKSKLERRFIHFLSHHGLPRAEVNAPIHLGDRFVEVDCLWRRQRMIVELDGRDVHGTGLAFEQDRARDRALAAQGWRVVRVTWRQLHEHSEELAADLAALLTQPVRLRP